MKRCVFPSVHWLRLRSCPVAVLGLLLPVLSLSAQEQSLEKAASDDVVKLEAFKVTSNIETYHQTTSSMASKVPMDLKELSSSLSILNAAAITDRNAVTLVDVFGYVVGATQSQGNINGFSFRGFPNTGSYTQNIQFDGLMGATLKKAATSASNVDSLEFLKGPNGVLYGQMNPGGLLNIVTKAPKETKETSIRTTVATFAGHFRTFGSQNNETVTADTTGPVGSSKHLFYRLIADLGNQPNSRPGNWSSAFSMYPSMTYKWSRETYFTVKGEVSEDFRRQDDGVLPIFTNSTAFGPTAYYYTAPLNTVYNDKKDKATDRGSAISSYFHAQLPGDWTLRMQTRTVWHLDVVRELTINNANVFSPTSTFAKPTSLLRRQYNYVKNGHRYNYGDVNLFRVFKTGLISQTVIFGAGGGGEFFGNQRIAFGPNQPVANAVTLVDPFLNQLDYPADGTGATNQLTYQTVFGEYVSDQVKIGDNLHVSFGIRHDKSKVHGKNVLSPALTTFSTATPSTTKQMGVVYDVSKTISPYFSYSQSVKPQVAIAYDSSGNSNFPPETGEQFEGGVKFDTLARDLNITAAAYEINRQNVLVASGTNFTVPTGSAQVGQAISRLDGKQQSKGVELEAQWQPIPNWQLQAGFAYSKAIIAASTKNPASVGLDLANAPRRTGNLWTRYNFTNGALQGFGAGFGTIYVGQAWAGDPTTTVYYRLPGWVRADSSFYYKMKNYDLALNVQNMFDRRYISSAQSALTLNIGEMRKLTFSVGHRF